MPSGKTWVVELFVVALLLCFVSWLGDGERLSILAVLLTFKHAQVSDRLREAVEARDPHVECSRWLDRYWMAKEVAWAVVFWRLGAWPALAGCFIFAAYPIWRAWWRTFHPRHRAPSVMEKSTYSPPLAGTEDPSKAKKED